MKVRESESVSKYPQVREIIYYGNDLAKSSNAGKPSNSKSPSKSYYSNPQLVFSVVT